MGTNAASPDNDLPAGEPFSRSGTTRSRLNHQANRMAGNRQDPERITAELDDIYRRQPSRLHNIWQRIQARLVGDPRW